MKKKLQVVIKLVSCHLSTPSGRRGSLDLNLDIARFLFLCREFHVIGYPVFFSDEDL